MVNKKAAKKSGKASASSTLMCAMVAKVNPIVRFEGNNAFEALTFGVSHLAADTGKLALTQMPTAIEQVRVLEAALEGTRKFMEKMVIDDVQKKGEPVPETKGSIALGAIRIRPWRTTFEDKKVEALIRSKGKEPQQYMDAQVKYVVNETKALEVLTKDELETCRYDLKYVLDLKNGKGNGNGEG